METFVIEVVCRVVVKVEESVKVDGKSEVVDLVSVEGVLKKKVI